MLSEFHVESFFRSLRSLSVFMIVSIKILRDFVLHREMISVVFRSREKISTTYPIVSFFSADLFMKSSRFSKAVHTIFIKFLHSYDWNVRNIAKISPKMAKIAQKQPFFDFFQFSQKLSIRFERNLLQSFYTVL